MQEGEQCLYDRHGRYGRSEFDGYRPPARAMHLTLLAFCLWSFAALWSFVAELGRLGIVERIAAGETLPLDDAAGSDRMVQLAAAAEVVAYVLAALAFLWWLRRIVVNNTVLGARDTRFSPRASLAWWFVPFANLLIPLHVVREAWRAADPARLHSTRVERDSTQVGWYVGVWWVVFTAGNIASYGAGLLRPQMDLLSSLRASSGTQMLAIAISWLAALLAMLVVIQLTHRQEAKAGAVEIAFGRAHTPLVETEIGLVGVPAGSSRVPAGDL